MLAERMDICKTAEEYTKRKNIPNKEIYKYGNLFRPLKLLKQLEVIKLRVGLIIKKQTAQWAKEM